MSQPFDMLCCNCGDEHPAVFCGINGIQYGDWICPSCDHKQPIDGTKIVWPPKVQVQPENSKTFREELSTLINKHCRENASNTPAYILAAFLAGCLDAFDDIVREREKWFGRDTEGK